MLRMIYIFVRIVYTFINTKKIRIIVILFPNNSYLLPSFSSNMSRLLSSSNQKYNEHSKIIRSFEVYQLLRKEIILNLDI